MTIKGTEELELKLSQLGRASGKIAEKALKAGAKPLADEIRKNLQRNLQGSKYSTGDLEKSFGVSPVRQNQDGDYDLKIGFKGYDRKGASNQLKARAMESGTTKQVKRPFVRPAVNAKKNEVIKEMEKAVDNEIKIVMG